MNFRFVDLKIQGSVSPVIATALYEYLLQNKEVRVNVLHLELCPEMGGSPWNRLTVLVES